MTIAEQIAKLQNSIHSLRASLLVLAACEQESKENIEIANETIALMKSHKRRLACLTVGK